MRDATRLHSVSSADASHEREGRETEKLHTAVLPWGTVRKPISHYYDQCVWRNTLTNITRIRFIICFIF